MQITSTGIISLPSVTTSMIDGDTTGKAIVTKEYLSSATAASNYWTKTGDNIANSNTGKILLFGSDYTNAGPGLNIVGSNSTSYGGNTTNKAIINFIPNPLGTPDNNVVSGIQSQDLNQGNVRAGIYFQAEVGNAGRPAIVFRTGPSLAETLRIGQNGIITATRSAFLVRVLRRPAINVARGNESARVTSVASADHQTDRTSSVT